MPASGIRQTQAGSDSIFCENFFFYQSITATGNTGITRRDTNLIPIWKRDFSAFAGQCIVFAKLYDLAVRSDG